MGRVSLPDGLYADDCFRSDNTSERLGEFRIGLCHPPGHLGCWLEWGFGESKARLLKTQVETPARLLNAKSEREIRMKGNEHAKQATLISCSMFFTLTALELFPLLRPGVNLTAIELSVYLVAAIAAGWLLGKSLEQTATHKSSS